MDPVTLAILRYDERKIRSALGWSSGLDPSLLAWDSGEEDVAELDGALLDDRSHAWEILAGTWRRFGGNIERTAGTSHDAVVTEVGQADVVVAADLVTWHPTGERDSGLVLRAVPEGHLITSVRTSSVDISQTIRIEKIQDGTRTTLSEATIPEEYRTHPARLWSWAHGDIVTVGLNGIPLLRYELTGGDESVFVGTKHGIGTRHMVDSGTLRWRNVAIWRGKL